MRLACSEIDSSSQRRLVALVDIPVDTLAAADTRLDLVLDIPVHIDILLVEGTFEVVHMVVVKSRWTLDLGDMPDLEDIVVAVHT